MSRSGGKTLEDINGLPKLMLKLDLERCPSFVRARICWGAWAGIHPGLPAEAKMRFANSPR
jgi:hypothetical protein